VPCHYLQVGSDDINGEPQHMRMDRKHHIWMHRIRKSRKEGKAVLLGNKSHLEKGSSLLLEDGLVEFVQSTDNDVVANTTLLESSDVHSENYCGDCYGAGEEGECCNTCDDLLRVVDSKGLNMEFLSYAQCLRVAHYESQELEGEGCNIHGIVSLSTTGGSVHVRPGKKPIFPRKPPIKKVVDAMAKRGPSRIWNVSHEIHTMRFGDE